MSHPHMVSSQFTTVEWLENLSKCWFQLKHKHMEYICEMSCCAHQFRLLYHQEINQLLSYPRLFYAAFFLLQIYRKILVFVKNLQGYKLRLEFQLCWESASSAKHRRWENFLCIFRKNKPATSRPWKLAVALWAYHRSCTARVTSHELLCDLAFPMGKIALVNSVFIS